MKSIWKGSLSFGLVTIPVKLYSATQSHALAFTLLHAACNTPIKQQRWCPRCEKTLEWVDIIKGIKRSDGTYFILMPEQVSQLRAKKTDRLDILEFIDYESIEPVFLDQHYYLAPSKINEHSYFLFVTTLSEMKKVALGRVTMKDKEHICVIQPFHQALLVTTVNYEYEVRNMEDIKELKGEATQKFSSAEIKLAKQLIKSMSVKKFNITKFNDSYAQELLKLFNAKAKKNKLTPGKKKKISPNKPKKHSALLENLKNSIDQWEHAPLVAHRSQLHKNVASRTKGR